MDREPAAFRRIAEIRRRNVSKIKALIGRQIGDSRYPDKKRINLYRREWNARTIVLGVSGYAAAMLLAILVMTYGIFTPLKQAERAERIYANMENTLTRLEEENRILSEVEKEYAHFGNGYQNEEESMTPDRIMMLHALKERIAPYCLAVSSISISDDRLDAECVLRSGSELAALVQNIEEDEHVRYVTVMHEEVFESDDAETDADRTVVDMEIFFHAPEKDGEA